MVISINNILLSFEVGMEQFINKPVKKRELQKLLEFYGLYTS
jgi:CheY-like chemotaxis protein